MSVQPSPLQRRILDFIASCIEDRGLPPTVREIGAHCGIASTGSVTYHLKALESLGLLKREARSSRAVAMVEPPHRLPIVGRVGAGGEVVAQEDIEGHLSVGKDVAHGAQFLLRVRGDSMRDAGILDGDLVQVRRQDGGRDRDIVVAVVGGERGVVKRLRREGPGWMLESAHPEHAPIREAFSVVGKVVGLIRKY